MKICFFSPYIPKHLGGGEKYLFDCMLVLQDQHQVYLGISELRGLSTEASLKQEQSFKNKYEAFLGEKLAKIEFIGTPLGTTVSFIEKLTWTRQFDVIYYATDGSLFFSLARKNILHIQVPLLLDKSGFIERLKLKNWSLKNCNSEFTKRVVEKSWSTTIDLVHQPMVKLPSNKAKQDHKKKIILNVGRFFKQLHSKRQDILVDLFRQLKEKHPQASAGWKLVLVGLVEDQAFTDQLKREAQGLPIEFYHQVSRDDLEKWYSQASLYWHATGYGVDETLHPEKVEHFGISTVEAMTYGCVPVVVGKGGQVEILGEQLSRFLWQTKKEAVKKTTQLMSDQQLWKKSQQAAFERAKKFDGQDFRKKLLKMVEG